MITPFRRLRTALALLRPARQIARELRRFNANTEAIMTHLSIPIPNSIPPSTLRRFARDTKGELSGVDEERDALMQYEMEARMFTHQEEDLSQWDTEDANDAPPPETNPESSSPGLISRLLSRPPKEEE